MDRFIVVRGLTETLEFGGSNVANWLVVDTTALVVYADCGDTQSRATAIAAALNAQEA